MTTSALFCMILGACADSGIDTDATYSNKDREDLYKHGSLLSDDGGSNLVGGAGNNKEQDASGIGVNGFIWRASLDTISFMPIASADPFGGVIITDWYSAPDNANERTKLNIFIRGRELRADGVRVSVFRQTKGSDGNWADMTVTPTTAGSLENAILTRARQIRMAQKQFQ